MNKVCLIGRLTREPELRFTAGTGIAVANFSIAVDRNYTNQKGEKQADFLTIICWRKLAEAVSNNLVKGQMVAVSGSIQTRKYQDENGINRYVTEIVADEIKFLSKPKNNSERDIPQSDEEFTPVNDEDIPF